MSLLGRLEDLSLTDIVQIVFLSRRTGVLEIVDKRGRHTVVFRGGLVVNASSPEHPDLLTYLVQKEAIPEAMASRVRELEEGGVPSGTAAIDLNLIQPEDLASAIRARIADVVGPLLESREGEFNFILSESMDSFDIEYDPSNVFTDGGLAPQRILGTADGEKIKPLRGLEESLRAGKALLRGSGTEQAEARSLAAPVEPPASIPPEPAADGEPASEPEPSPLASEESDNILPFPSREEPFAPVTEEDPFPDSGAAASEDSSPGEAADAFGGASESAAEPELTPSEPPQQAAQPASDATPQARPLGRFRVAGGLFDIESPDAQYRNVVLFERNPLVRVASRRAFTKRHVRIFQYGSLEDARASMGDLFRSNSFFVSFLELTEDDGTLRLMQQLKRKNPRLPVVVIDAEADLRRRHDLLRAGADLYLTKPTPARLQPGLAEEELALFADEMLLFFERAFAQWEQVSGGSGAEAGRKFYEMASQDSMDRSYTVLKQLINELSNPNDISQVAATILRLSAEYLDRGALFVVADDEFVGLGGFGNTGGGVEMDSRVRDFRLPRSAPSVLSTVSETGQAHRGKMKKTAANVALVDHLGGSLPTEVLALPIMHGGRAVGILYGDNAGHRAPIDSVTGLEIFLSQAGYAFGNAVFAAEKARR